MKESKPHFEKHRIEKAREKLLKVLPFKRIRKISKYKNLTLEQYLRLIDRLENLSLFIIESFLNRK